VFSKEESKQLRQHFWTSFGKSFPRKWILYNTKIKGLSLKFHFDIRKAIVSLDVDLEDIEKRINLWEKLQGLRNILKSEFLPGVIFDDSYLLDNKKEISRIYVIKSDVSIHDKSSWQETMQFFNENMKALEQFFETYKEIIDSQD